MRNELKYHKVSSVHHICISNDKLLADIYYLSPNNEDIDYRLCYLLIFIPTNECIFTPNLQVSKNILENAWALLNLEKQNG